MKSTERIVAYVNPGQKDFLDLLCLSSDLSKSALVSHILHSLQAKYKFLHSLPLKERLIAIAKSYNLYCVGANDGIRIGDKNFQQKIRFSDTISLKELLLWLDITYKSHLNAYKSEENAKLSRWIETMPLIISDLQIYSAEISFEKS